MYVVGYIQGRQQFQMTFILGEISVQVLECPYCILPCSTSFSFSWQIQAFSLLTSALYLWGSGSSRLNNVWAQLLFFNRFEQMEVKRREEQRQRRPSRFEVTPAPDLLKGKPHGVSASSDNLPRTENLDVSNWIEYTIILQLWPRLGGSSS